MESRSVCPLSQIEPCINRGESWVRFINQKGLSDIVEIGVWKGEFAALLLSECKSINRYFMVDPWAHLSDWNKPFNISNSEFELVREEAMLNTSFAKDKVVELRNTTQQASKFLEDDSLDFAYIDGDHTLRGITLDLNVIYPKVKQGGYIGGDDLCTTPWQHNRDFEPTLVFPYVVFFAESMGVPVFALGQDQFLIIKDSTLGFRFTDLTGNYGCLELRSTLK